MRCSDSGFPAWPPAHGPSRSGSFGDRGRGALCFHHHSSLTAHGFLHLSLRAFATGLLLWVFPAFLALGVCDGVMSFLESVHVGGLCLAFLVLVVFLMVGDFALGESVVVGLVWWGITFGADVAALVAVGAGLPEGVLFELVLRRASLLVSTVVLSYIVRE